MADTPQQVISKLQLTPDRKTSYKKITDKASTNTYIINELQGVLSALSSLPEKDLKQKTGLSLKDVDGLRQWRNQVIDAVSKTSGKSFSGGKFKPGQEEQIIGQRQQTIKQLQTAAEPGIRRSQRGLGGEISTAAKNFIAGYQAPRRAAELTKRGLPISMAYEDIPQDDPTAVIASEVGEGFGQTFAPTVATLPGLAAGGAGAGLLDRAIGSRLPNNGLIGLLRTGAMIGGSMAGANVTGGLYNKYAGPYAGLNEEQTKQIAGAMNQQFGGAAETLGQVGATASIFGAPATNDKGQLSFIEGAGFNRSLKGILRNPNQALANPAVKETIGDISERLYSINETLTESGDRNQELISNFIAENGREPTRAERDALKVKTPEQRLAAVTADLLFGGTTKLGGSFNPFNLLSAARGGSPNQPSPQSPVTPQQPGGPVQAPVQPGAMPTAPIGAGLFNFRVNLKRQNTPVPHTITFDTSTGKATVNPSVDVIDVNIANPASEKLTLLPPVTVGNTDVSVRHINPDGSIITMVTDKLTGLSTLQSTTFNALPPALQTNIDSVLQNTRLGNKRFPVSGFPTTSTYNADVDALPSFADDYKTKINIDGKDVNVAVVDVKNDTATVLFPSGMRMTLPKTFFATEPVKQQRLPATTRTLANAKYKVGTTNAPVSVQDPTSGIDFFVAEPRRGTLAADPASWAASYRNVPPDAQRLPVGTVVDLGVFNGGRQVGVVLAYKDFPISGTPAAGYVVQSLNDPRMTPFMVPHDPLYIPAISPGDNPFVSTTPTPATATPAPATATAAPTAATTTPTPATATPAAATGTAPALPATPTVVAPTPTIDTSVIQSAIADAPTVVPTLIDYLKQQIESDDLTDEQEGILDIDAIGAAIGYDNLDALDEIFTAAVDAGLIKQDPAGFEFDDLAAADPAQAVAAIQGVLQSKLSAVPAPATAPTPAATAPTTPATVPTPAAAATTPVTPAPAPAATTPATPVPASAATTPAAAATTPATGSSSRINLVMFAVPLDADEQLIADKITDEYNSTDPTRDQLRSVTINLDDLSASTGVDKPTLHRVLSKLWGNNIIAQVAGDTYDLSGLYKPRTSTTATTAPSSATPVKQNVTGIDAAAWAAMPIDQRIEMVESNLGEEAIALEVIKANQADFDALMPTNGNPLVLGASSPSYAQYSNVVKGAIISYLNARGLDTTGLADQLQGAVDQTVWSLHGVKFKVDPAYEPIFNRFISGLGTKAPSDTNFEGNEEIRLRSLNDSTAPPTTPTTPTPTPTPAATAPIPTPTPTPGPTTSIPTSAPATAAVTPTPTPAPVEDLTDLTDLGDTAESVNPRDTGTRAPREPSSESDVVPPESYKTPEGKTAFPYGEEFGEPAKEGTLPVEMEDYRADKTRYRRQTKGEETRPVSLNDFRKAVPEWAQSTGGFRRMVGKFIAPILNALTTDDTPIDKLELDLKGVKDKQDLYVSLQDVFGQTPEQAAALAEWVDRFSLAWAREFARMHGINTMDRLRASRVTEDPAPNPKKDPKTGQVLSSEKWKLYYREQMAPKHSEENARILKELQTVFYTQRLGTIGLLPTTHRQYFGNTTGMTFSIGGDGKRAVNVVLALHGKENYVTQVHEINHALVRSLYAPMIHQLASKVYRSYRQVAGDKKSREIQRDIEERIVTEMTNMMFNAPGDFNLFTENENAEGGFDVSLNKLIMDMGQLMRDSIADPKDKNDPNNVANKDFKGWNVSFPQDATEQKKLAVGTPIIVEEIVFGGRRVKKTYHLAKTITPGSEIKVMSASEYKKSYDNGDYKAKTKDIDPQTIYAIGQTEVKSLSKPVNQYLSKFFGHWYEHTVNMIAAYNPDVNVDDIDFGNMSVVETTRNTVGFRWWDDVKQAKEQFPLYNDPDFSDERISARVNDSYLGWADKGGYEAYREDNNIPVESYEITSGLPGYVPGTQSQAIEAVALVGDQAQVTPDGVVNAELSMEDLLNQAIINGGATGDIDFMNRRLPRAKPMFMNKSLEELTLDDLTIQPDDLPEVEGEVTTESTPEEKALQRAKTIAELNQASTQNLHNAVVEQAKSQQAGRTSKRYLDAVDGLVRSRYVPSIFQGYIKSKHAWLEGVRVFTSRDGKTWTASKFQHGDDLVASLYTASSEAVTSVLSQLRPVQEEGGGYSRTKLQRAYKDANGVIQWQTINSGDAWTLMRREMTRSAQNAVNELRRVTSERVEMPYRNPHLQKAKLQTISNGNLTEGTAAFEQEVIRTAAIYKYLEAWNRSNQLEGPEMIGQPLRGTYKNILDLRMPKELKDRIQEILDSDAYPEGSKPYEIYSAIMASDKSVIEGLNSTPIFRVIHAGYTTRDNKLSSNAVVDTIFTYRDGVMYVPEIKQSKLKTLESQMSDSYVNQQINENAGRIISLDEVIGTDEGGRTIGESIMSETKSVEDEAESGNGGLMLVAYKHRAIKAVAALTQSDTYVDEFLQGSYGIAQFDAQDGNQRRESIGKTLDKYYATMAEAERLAPAKLSAPKLKQQAERKKRVDEYNAFIAALKTKTQKQLTFIMTDWAMATEKAQASVNIYNAIKLLIDNPTGAMVKELERKGVLQTVDATTLNKIVKAKQNAPHAFNALSNALSVLESTVTKSEEVGRETAEYHELNLSLTPVESVILSARSANLRRYGIVPAETGTSIRADQLIAGLHIGTPKYDAALKNILDRINNIEGTKLNQYYDDNVTGYAQQVKAVVTQIDATLAEIEDSHPKIWETLKDLSMNERRLHILMERTQYISRDEKGNIQTDPVLVEFGSRMRNRMVTRALEAKAVGGEVSAETYTEAIDATVDALYSIAVIQPEQSFSRKMLEGTNLVTHQKLTQESDDTVLRNIIKTLNGKSLTSMSGLRGKTLYERVLGFAGITSNQNQILSDDQLKAIARLNNEKESPVVQSVIFARLQQERNDFIQEGIGGYLEKQGKALESMTVEDLNGYLSDMDRNQSFSVMSNILKLLTQERSSLLPFITYTGRLPYADEISQIANQIHEGDPSKKIEDVTKRVLSEFGSLQEKVAKYGLEYMTNAANVTSIQTTVSSETNRRSISYGLTLNNPADIANPVGAQIRRQIITQQAIFGDKDSGLVLEKFGFIHDAVNDLIVTEINKALPNLRESNPSKAAEIEKYLALPKDELADKIQSLIGVLPRNVAQAVQEYVKFRNDTSLLTQSNVNKLIWGKAVTKADMKGRGRTNIPAPGKGTKATYGTTPEFIFAEAVKKRTRQVIDDFVKDLYASDATFALTKQAFRGFDAPTLKKILDDPNFAAQPENREIKTRLEQLTEAIAKDMVQGRMEIIRALKDPKYATYDYTLISPDNPNLVKVTDAAGKHIMTIDYKLSMYMLPGQAVPLSTPSPSASRKSSYTQSAIVNLILSTENVNVIRQNAEFFNQFPEAQRQAVIDIYKKQLEAETKTRNAIVAQMSSMQNYRVMPAEYWHGRDRVQTPTRRTAEPMFMNRRLDEMPSRIDSLIGTRSPETVDMYVKPVISKWIQPDENGLRRVQLNVDGVPAWDGYGYTVQTPSGARSNIYANLRTMGLPHHKALEVYALTEHPEFKKWQSGDLVDSVHLNQPGSLEYHGVSMTTDEKEKLQVVMNAHNLQMAIDEYNNKPTAKNYESMKYWYDEVFPVGDDGKPLTNEQLEKRVQEIANDSIKLEAVRVQADTIKSAINTPEVQYFSNPVMAHMEGRVQLRTGKSFTTLAFGVAANNMLNYSADGVRVHDLGSGLHKNDNKKQQPRWIKMDNPLVVDLKNNGIDAPSIQPHMEKALSRGHDGVVFTNYRDSMFSTVSRNIAITLDDNNVKSVATMHVDSEGGRPKATRRTAQPMFMNRRLEAPVTRSEAPTLLSVELEDVKKSRAEKTAEGALWLYDNYQAFTRSALALDFAFTFIQGGRAALGLVTGRPMDSVWAAKALACSFAGLAPNTSITMFGKQIGFDKLGRRAYMSMYLSMRKDPMWQVAKDLKLPLHMLNMEKRIESERNRLYREAGGTINYEDIPIDLMQYDERGNLVDYFESNTLIGAIPFQGMFERQISIQHDVLLFSLLKHQLKANPVFKDVSLEELASDKYAQLIANYLSLSMGDFQYSTDEKVDAKWGRIGKIAFVAPRWLFANVMLNPMVNRYMSQSTKARQFMGEKNRVFDLYPKDLGEKNAFFARYQFLNYWGTAMFLLGMQLYHKFRGMMTGDGRYNANPKKLANFRNGDWDISDSTGTFDLVNVPWGWAAAALSGDPERQATGQNSTAGEYLIPVSYTHLTLPTKRIV